MEIIAIIPARKGSKRLPNKNILNLCGKPLIEYTIEEAIKSKYIDTIIISSDCNVVKQIVNKYKNHPAYDIFFHRRPEMLCGDNILMEDVIEDVANKYKGKIYVILQPTSPLRTTEDIDKCIELILFNDFDSVISVEKLDTFYTFIPNGAVYAIKNGKQRYNNKMGLFSMPHERSIDIDTKLDFMLAELIINESK